MSRNASVRAVAWKWRATLRNSLAVALVFLAFPSLASQKWDATRICKAIAAAAANYNVPRDMFARLIWTESRFDRNALSPVGAQGIAQFMPATARARGLADPFDPAQAIPASASLLRDHRDELGNWVLAAAAYNAGVDRVSRWVTGRSRTLPFETQNYIVSIFSVRVDRYRDPAARVRLPKLKGRNFDDACAKLPVRRTRATAIAGIDGDGIWAPWGVQVAGNFSQARAINSWLRVRARLGLVVDGTNPSLYRQRAPRGMRAKWTVRLGAASQGEAQRLCSRIRRAGGFCIVRRNRG